ncbi:kinase-like protein, partial [Neoconidiobolus thromboides FSU 785]
MSQPNGQDVSEVRQQLNESNLASYLTQHLHNFSAPLKLNQFKLGQSNPTYLLSDSRNQRWVLRKKPPGNLISQKAHAIEREYLVLKQLNCHSNVPVPKVYLLCEDNSVLGTPFYIMEFVEGDIHENVELKHKTMEERKKIWYSAIEVLAKLHSVDIKSAELQSYGPLKNYYPRQIQNLLKLADKQAETKGVKQLYRMNELKELFGKFPIEDKVSIIHGDFKVDNLIYKKNSHEIIGILDWELSTLGNPLFDLSNLLQPFYSEDYGKQNPDLKFFKSLHDSKLLPPNFREELIEYYCQLTNREYPIKNWNACVAFSFFRLSIIIQGISARYLRGQASSQKAHLYIQALEPISKTTVNILTQNS